jgi:uracil-DNA glycosylase family 4
VPGAADAGGDPALAPDLPALDAAVTRCRACPRLVAWREEVAETRRAAFRDETYWGRPVPGFGATDARLVIVGLAPAAHGANRTGRMFTGDRSGDVLYAALYAVGLASQPTAVAIGDGLELYGTRITAPVRCAPPENKPTPAERDRCRPWLARELALLRPTLRAVVVLGGFGWQALLPVLAAPDPAGGHPGWVVPRPRPTFGHAAHVTLAPADAERSGEHADRGAGPSRTDPATAGPLELFGCYHVSQQNTFTGRLTPAMLEDVLATAADAAGLDRTPPHRDHD